MNRQLLSSFFVFNCAAVNCLIAALFNDLGSQGFLNILPELENKDAVFNLIRFYN